MKKKKFAIIGNPISHSLSPTMHNYWFKKYNIDAEYELLDIDKNEIQNVIDKIKNKEIKGINVTLPYKNFVISFLYKCPNFMIVGSQPNNFNFLLKNDRKVPSLLPISKTLSPLFKLIFFIKFSAFNFK